VPVGVANISDAVPADRRRIWGDANAANNGEPRADNIGVRGAVNAPIAGDDGTLALVFTSLFSAVVLEATFGAPLDNNGVLGAEAAVTVVTLVVAFFSLLGKVAGGLGANNAKP
jgi:hypothetical protein